MSNLGPLTTTYIESASNCNSIFLANNNALIHGTVWPSQQASCLPSSYIGLEGFYYSPGICPSGYSYACSSSFGDGAGNNGIQATCCPRYEGTYIGAAAQWWPLLGVTKIANACGKTADTAVARAVPRQTSMPVYSPSNQTVYFTLVRLYRQAR